MTASSLAVAVPVVARAAPAPVRRRTFLGVRVRLAFGAIVASQGVATILAASQMQGAAAIAAVGAGLAATALTVATGAWLLRSVIGGLRPATLGVAGIGAGDLGAALPDSGATELRPLMQGLAQVREQLLGIVSRVRTATVNVAMNAAQVRRDNETLAQRTETQAESLQETAASMEELTAAVRHTAETAQEAHAVVRAATARAEEGGEVMRGVVEAMGAIRAGSHSIRDIIGVIDGIAFQTNILALNAAVEAARAGEQGRGFAVVAGEVRTLSQRCAEAAREIRTLIGVSLQQVDSGGARVDEAGRAMEEIVGSVRQVAGLIAQMHVASREQSSGIENINEAIARIDGTTQHNAALVKAGERTVAALQERAASLWTMLEGFRLGEREHASAEDTLGLVAAGCEFLRAHGRDALLAEVNKLDFGRFIHRDLYLMVLRLQDGVFVAHGNNPGRLGTGPDVRDVDGKHFAREAVRVARERGEGWVDYKWVHPVSGEVTVKNGYVRREGDLALYCAMRKG